jgi:hypothetical protein
MALTVESDGARPSISHMFQFLVHHRVIQLKLRDPGTEADDSFVELPRVKLVVSMADDTQTLNGLAAPRTSMFSFFSFATVLRSCPGRSCS